MIPWVTIYRSRHNKLLIIFFCNQRFGKLKRILSDAAGSPEATAIADKYPEGTPIWNVHPHNQRDIYFRFSPITDTICIKDG